MPHPNQLALPVAVSRWIDQSLTMPDTLAASRLYDKLSMVTEAINIIASDEDELPVELAGLSVIDLMSAQASLTIEIGTRRRFAEIEQRCGAAA